MKSIAAWIWIWMAVPIAGCGSDSASRNFARASDASSGDGRPVSSGGAAGGAPDAAAGSSGASGGNAGASGGNAGASGGSAGAPDGGADAPDGARDALSDTADSALQDVASDSEAPRACNPLLSDCRVGEYCKATGCSANGVCSPRPTLTAAQFAPVCGCDGVTYWNAQHANWLGKAAGTSGRCTSIATKTCNLNGTGCGAGEYCYRRWSRGGTCGSTVGVSWSQCYSRPTTVDCPTAPDNDGAQLCPAACGGATTCCTNECVLARDGMGQAAEGCGA